MSPAFIASLVLTVAAALSVGASAPCPQSCSLNGACVNGTCVCDSVWEGKSCARLRIGPTCPECGLQPTVGASWGGNALFVDGQWHLFAARILGGCNLDHYGTNSAVVRAVSTTGSPLGPYEVAQEIRRPFAHNPTVRQLSNSGGFLLFTIGGNPNSTTVPRNCSSGRDSSHGARDSSAAFAAHKFSSPSAATSHRSWTMRRFDKAPQSTRDRLSMKQTGGDRRGALHRQGIWVAHAPTVTGPWSQDAVQIDFTGLNYKGLLACSITNPSPYVYPNGTVLLAFTAGFCNASHEVIGVATPSWRGPYSIRVAQQVFPRPDDCYFSNQQYEDPFLWRDARGFHLLLHGMCPAGYWNAKLAFSHDGITWAVADEPPYTYLVEVWRNMTMPSAAGKSATGGPSSDAVRGVSQESPELYEWFFRMERPQLAFDPATGAPVAIMNGVQKLNFSAPHWLDMSYTLARPLLPKA